MDKILLCLNVIVCNVYIVEFLNVVLNYVVFNGCFIFFVEGV